MRKTGKACIAIVAVAAMALALCACGGGGAASSSASSAASASSSATAASGKTLVACFSVTGNTAPLAKYAAEALDADLYEIVPAQPYTSADLNYNDNSTRATREQHDSAARPAIAGQLPVMSQYSTVVLAYPIWWGEAPRIMDTFVESVDLSGKTVAAMCTSGSSGIGSSDKNLAQISKGKANWLEGHRFAAGASKADVESWLKSIGLVK